MTVSDKFAEIVSRTARPDRERLEGFRDFWRDAARDVWRAPTAAARLAALEREEQAAKALALMTARAKGCGR